MHSTYIKPNTLFSFFQSRVITNKSCSDISILIKYYSDKYALIIIVL